MMQLPGIKFKSANLETEFLDCAKTDPRVRSIALELGIVAARAGFVLTVTQIGRSVKEQTRYYGKDQRSGHRELPARAIDFRARNLNSKQIIKLTNHFSFYLDSGSYSSLLYHQTKTGYHLHLQVPHRDYNVCLWKSEN